MLITRVLILLVRKLRPWLVPLTVVALIGLQVTRSSSSSGMTPSRRDGGISCLEWMVLSLQQSQHEIIRLIDESSLPGKSIWMLLCRWCYNLLQDGMAVMVVGQVLRIIYCLSHFTRAEWKEKLVRNVFFWARSNIPAVQAAVNQGTSSFVAASEAEEMLGKDPDRILTLQLPTQGRLSESIVEELQAFANKENLAWQKGQVSGSVYGGDEKHTQLMERVYALYVWSNPLHAGLWPKVNQCEAEVITMTADMLHAPKAFGTLTSGGTESVILAVRAHLIYYGKRRSITHPEIVAGTSAHASLRKACEMFGIRLVSIDVDNPQHRGCRLQPSEVKRFITSNTIMIFASAPTFPQGSVDPISELSQLSLDYDIGLHVDACLGGFVLPFCADAPLFDFRNKGVTSMSVDTHKYGYASKGTSVVLYRSRELRQSQYFAYPHWTGGMYVTPTMAGSRSGALAACAWASMVYVGKTGYANRVRDIVAAARKIATGLQTIKGLQLLTAEPVFMVVCFGSSEEDSVEIYRVSDAMKEKGWSLNALQAPASVHVCVTLSMVPKVDLFLNDLRDAVGKARSEGKDGRTKGSAGIYGTVGKLPDGPVECVLQTFTDMTLTP